MGSYPIDTVLPDVVQALGSHPGLLLQASPGAGKTTRVPLALLQAPFLKSSRIVMLEPRRLAAVNAARWMAALLGEEVGRTIGYTIRFDRKVSAATRIEVVTEGVLTRRLQHDPDLDGVGLVIFDEFHERSIHADLSLALCRDVQTALRTDLKLLVMSATLDCAPIAGLLGDVPVISCSGRSFPVEIRYSETSGSEDSVSQVVMAVNHSLRRDHGDILALLPGAGEITRCRRMLEESPEAAGTAICPLYGDLPFAEQEKAIQPQPGRRKVVLSTNIAETSLTIEGVSVVVDSGWCRRLRFNPSTGLNRLVLERVTAASADQRAGRAGRLGPGICYRLWDRHQQRTLLPFNPPEITTADLASLVLDLALWGLRDPSSLRWLDPPPASAYAEAQKLLVRLGAFDAEARITPLGRKMAEMPLHPRLAALAIAATEIGAGEAGAEIAALLSERDIFRRDLIRGRAVSRSDILDRLEALSHFQSRLQQDRATGLDPQAVKTVIRTATELKRYLDGKGGKATAELELVGELLLAAYPDRVAMRREPGSRRYLLANGRGAQLAEQSALGDESWVVAVNIEGGEGSEGRIRMATAITPDILRDRFPEQVQRRRVVVWDKREQRVIAREEERYDNLLLSSKQLKPSSEESAQALITGVLAGPGLSGLNWSPAADHFVHRVRFLFGIFPGEWPDFSEQFLEAHMEEWLAPFLGAVTSMADLRKVDLLSPLQSLLSWEQKKRLEEGAPSHVTVPSGSRVRIDYGSGAEPVLAVKLQELFGLAETPRIAWGRFPLVLHLLSPAGRPIQVTRDLRSFWNNGYSDVKKELKGRYPKHPWPDDPWAATPTKHTKKKS